MKKEYITVVRGILSGNKKIKKHYISVSFDNEELTREILIQMFIDMAKSMWKTYENK